ncbi:MAG: hypothetical protein LBD58_03185 [Treponema sp.]|jgi:hypothetical protein|nr:hypothetical protein [Treponema sp.]
MAQEKSFDLKEEFAGVDFHSIRLEQRFVRAMETLMRRPDKSIWGAGENRAEAEAVCRMLGDEGFDRGEIIRARREAAIGRAAGHGGAILPARDAAGVNCHTRLKTEGMGRIGDKAPGVDVHSRLAAAADGLVLGVLDQSGYNRAETKDEPASREVEKVRPIEEEEGFRRTETLERGTAAIPEGVKAIAVCDREGDMAD